VSGLSRDLSTCRFALSCGEVKARLILPILLTVVFALSRWPGLMPWNFSAAYAMMFCAGVYFPRRLVWWLPFVIMLATDLALNIHYHGQYGTPVFSAEMLANYLAYFAAVWLGRKLTRRASWPALIGGGLLSAILFYLITNTWSWFFNPFHAPEYTKTLLGWITALTRGTAGYMETWKFFGNTLLSGGIFTALFAGTMKMAEAAEPEPEEAPAESEPDKQSEPEEAKA